MNGLYLYKLISQYKEDVTKDCKLTVNEIDHNFMTLKDADIKSVSYDKVNSIITLVRNDGEEIAVDMSETLDGVTRNLEVEYDSIDGVITISHNGETTVLNGLVTKDNLSVETLTEVISDGSLVGLGAKKSPLKLSPVEKTGVYKPALKLVDTLNGEQLPTVSHRKLGDRYVTHELVNKYGLLYNFPSVRKLNEKLTNGWRVPTKEDWDNMLNAIEPCDEYRNHNSALANNMLGKYAGKLLKANDTWLRVDGCDDDNSTSDVLNESDEFDVELETSRRSVRSKLIDPVGTDNYGMGLLPSGFYDNSDLMGYFLKRGYYWTSSQCNATDVYTKRFDFDKSGVVQTVESPTSYFSIRLVKDYDGSNHFDVEDINGIPYKTVLLPALNTELGHSVWTMDNIAFDDENLDFVVPNNGSSLDSRDAYYINEWNGKEWVKKEMSEGESIVLLTATDGTKGKEYRIIGGKLIEVSQSILSDVINKFEPQIEEIENIIGEGFKDESGNTVPLTEIINNNVDKIDKAQEIIGSGFTDSEGNTISLTEKIANDIDDVDDRLSGLENAIEEEGRERLSAFTEIKAEIKEINDYLDSFEQDIFSAITTEQERAILAENELRDNLNSEIERSKAADSALTTALSEEIDRAKEAESGLTSLIEAETSRAVDAEEILDGKIDDETTRAEQEEAAIKKTLERLVNAGEYDSVNGTLILKADKEDNDIVIQLNGNYGTF